MTGREARRLVLSEFPSAWFNSNSRQVEGYSEGLVLGTGSVIARSTESSAWIDAAENIKHGRIYRH